MTWKGYSVEEIGDRGMRQSESVSPPASYGAITLWTDPSDGKIYFITRMHDGTSNGRVVGVEATEIT